MGMEQSENTPPTITLRDYIRRDLAYAHGIDRDMLADLDAKPKGEWSSTHRQWGLYAEKAEIGALDWIVGNAPRAVPPLRAAGLYIFIPDEEPTIAAPDIPSMAEIIGEHTLASIGPATAEQSGPFELTCHCSGTTMTAQNFADGLKVLAAHVAQKLNEAGYGSLHDAWNEGKDALANAFLKPAVDGLRAVTANPHPRTTP